jgi:hypothetical protein
MVYASLIPSPSKVFSKIYSVGQPAIPNQSPYGKEPKKSIKSSCPLKKSSTVSAASPVITHSKKATSISPLNYPAPYPNSSHPNPSYSTVCP